MEPGLGVSRGTWPGSERHGVCPLRCTFILPVSAGAPDADAAATAPEDDRHTAGHDQREDVLVDRLCYPCSYRAHGRVS